MRLITVLFVFGISSLAGARDVVPTTKGGESLPVIREREVPQEIKDNKVAYEALKRNLGIKDEELSRTDVLEIIAVKFAGILDKLSADVACNANNIKILEQNTLALEQRIQANEKKLKDQDVKIRTMDSDLTKLFDWQYKVDNELYKTDGMCWRMDQVERSVKSNESDIEILDKAIRNQKAVNESQDNDIRELAWAIRRLGN